MEFEGFGPSHNKTKILLDQNWSKCQRPKRQGWSPVIQSEHLRSPTVSPKLPRVPQEGCRVQGWVSVCRGVLGIPLLEKEKLLGFKVTKIWSSKASKTKFQSFEATKCQSLKISQFQSLETSKLQICLTNATQIAKHVKRAGLPVLFRISIGNGINGHVFGTLRLWHPQALVAPATLTSVASERSSSRVGLFGISRIGSGVQKE